jgi:hypothetical protein
VLDAIATPEYGEVLRELENTSPEIERVTLRDLKLVGLDDFATRQILSSSDVLGSLRSSNIDPTSTVIQQASFSIVPRVKMGRRRCYRMTVWKGNQMKHDSPWSERTVQELLTRLRLRREIP